MMGNFCSCVQNAPALLMLLLLCNSNAGDTLCIPRLRAECMTGVIQKLPSLAMEKLSVEQAKLETSREVCSSVLRPTFQCLLVL